LASIATLEKLSTDKEYFNAMVNGIGEQVKDFIDKILTIKKN
jgi:hypothetical protein